MVNKYKDIIETREDQRERWGQFIGHLADDPVLKSNRSLSRYTLTEILQEARYPIEQIPVIDIALLLTLLFQEKGLNCTSDDLVRHVLNGGSIEQFIEQAYVINECNP